MTGVQTCALPILNFADAQTLQPGTPVSGTLNDAGLGATTSHAVSAAPLTGANGAYCTIGGRAAIDIAREVCGGAAATIAIGTCAAFGGLPAAAPNPTGALSVADYKDDPRQSTRKLDRFEGDSDRVWGTYTQYLGAMGPFDDVEFSWTNFAQHSYRNFVVGLPFAPDATPTTLQDAPRDFRVWGSEPRLSLGIDGDGVSQTWLLGARLVKENVDFDVDRLNLNTGATSVVRDWVFDTKGQAAYVSNEIKLLDDRLTLTPGVRYEHAKMEYADGVSGIDAAAWLADPRRYFLFTLAVVCACLWLLYRIKNSPFGVTLQAVRDNPRRCEEIGRAHV